MLWRSGNLSSGAISNPQGTSKTNANELHPHPMKKSILLVAGLAAAAFTTQSSAADLVIRLTGSSAFRSLADTKIVGLGFTRVAGLSNGTWVNYQKVTNTPNSGDKTILKTNWSGSVAGIKTVATSDTTVPFLPDAFTNGGAATNSGNATDTGTAPDIAFSDVFQSSTLYTTPTLSKSKVGVVQFRAVTNADSPITKVNYQQLRALFTTSTGLPLSSFTGNTFDAGTKVYGIGRDPDSGTRITFLAETGIGANSTVVHWHPKASASVTDACEALVPWEPSTAFGTTFAEGNGGYASGGTLAGVMRLKTGASNGLGGVKVGPSGPATANNTPDYSTALTATAAPCYFISFAGLSDVATILGAANATGAPGHVLTIENNDSDISSTTQLSADVMNGLNTMWGYEWMYHNGLTGDKLQFFTDLASAVSSTANAGVSLADMKVQRLIDGGVILPK